MLDCLSIFYQSFLVSTQECWLLELMQVIRHLPNLEGNHYHSRALLNSVYTCITNIYIPMIMLCVQKCYFLSPLFIALYTHVDYVTHASNFAMIILYCHLM